MIGKTNATLEITSEMVNLTLQTNQNDHDDLLGTEITVTYADVINTYIWEGRELLIKIPKYAKYTITFESVEGYKTPDSFSSVALEKNSISLKAEYKTELVTIEAKDNNGNIINNATFTINGNIYNGPTKIAHDSSYIILALPLEDYSTPENITGIASELNKLIVIIYEKYLNLTVNINGIDKYDITLDTSPIFVTNDNLYVPVEFIELESYINTGFCPSYQSRVIMDISTTTNGGHLFGVRDTKSKKSPNQFRAYKGASEIGYGYFGNYTINNYSNSPMRGIVDANLNTLDFLGTFITNPETTKGKCLNPLYIGGLNDAGYASDTCRFSLYSCLIYDNNILMRDFIPVVDAFNQYCFFDKIENKGHDVIYYGECGERLLTTLATQVTKTATYKIPNNTLVRITPKYFEDYEVSTYDVFMTNEDRVVNIEYEPQFEEVIICMLTCLNDSCTSISMEYDLNVTVSIDYNEQYYNISDRLAGVLTIPVPDGSEYTIKAPRIPGFITPKPYKGVASKGNRTYVDMRYFPNRSTVMIVDNIGNLHSLGTWNSSRGVTGIYIQDLMLEIIIAIDQPYSQRAPRTAWGGEGTLVSNCTTSSLMSDISEIYNDMEGELNTKSIIELIANTSDGYSAYTGAPAAEYCYTYSKGYKGVGEWYLPSVGEVFLILNNREAIDEALSIVGGDPLTGTQSNWLWTSTQDDAYRAWYIDVDELYVHSQLKSQGRSIRPICKP